MCYYLGLEIIDRVYCSLDFFTLYWRNLYFYEWNVEILKVGTCSDSPLFMYIMLVVSLKGGFCSRCTIVLMSRSRRKNFRAHGSFRSNLDRVQLRTKSLLLQKIVKLIWIIKWKDSLTSIIHLYLITTYKWKSRGANSIVA